MTDSEVSRKEGDELKEVVTTAANDNRGGKSNREGRGPRSGSVALSAVLGRLAEKLGLQSEDVVEHPIDAPALETVIRNHTRAFEIHSQGCTEGSVNPRLAADLRLL